MFVIGLNHKTAPIEIREKFYLNNLEADLLISELKNNPLVSEAFVLSTCNRIEVYLKRFDKSINRDSIIHLISKIKKTVLDLDYDRYIYTFEDQEAIEHLLRVSCGLDSMVLGEKQILGQVKMAVERARELGAITRYFNILTNIAIRAGKKAQHDTEISLGGSSISWAAIEMAQTILGTLSGKSVLVIGAGKMGELALGNLTDKGLSKIYLMNRTGEKAEQLAQKYNGIAASFWDIKEILSEVDLCFCSVGAPHYILDHAKISDIMQRREGKPIVLIDISMPRNIDPLVAGIENVHLCSIDDLTHVVGKNMKKRQEAIVEVEAIIKQKIQEFDEKMAKLNSLTGFEFA